MLKSLQTIHKIAKMELDDEARNLAILNSELNRLHSDRTECETRIITDTKQKSEETLAYIPQFIKAMRDRSKMLTEKINEQNKLVEAQENIVRDKFLN